tara:strand:+ start:8917 stop:9135 length:219 start_codon:yes stop_codon:yes gene_type:complete
MTNLEQIFNKDNLNHFNNIKKLEELKKIDYHLDIYIRNHTKVLLSVPGATEMSVATLIVNRIKNIINKVNDE